MLTFPIKPLMNLLSYGLFNKLTIVPKCNIYYTHYRLVMIGEDIDLKEEFAKARAIYFSMRHGALTYQQAKLRTSPILRRINAYIEIISKRHKIKPQYIAFQNLGVNL